MTHTYISLEIQSPWWQDLCLVFSSTQNSGTSKDSVHICHVKICWACECRRPYISRKKSLKYPAYKIKYVLLVQHLRVPGLLPSYDRCILPLKTPTHPRLQSRWPMSFPPQRATHFHSVKPLLVWLPNPGIPPSLTPPLPQSPKSYLSFKVAHLNNIRFLFTSPPLQGIYLALDAILF